jgi:branched-chain amino acid aminotransferase
VYPKKNTPYGTERIFMKKKIDWDNLGFEINPADRMFIAQYRAGRWDAGKIVDYGPIPLYPSAVILNYGQGLFEGMKAYRTKDGRLAMFRPLDNAKRVNTGCRRLCMPEIDEQFFVGSIVGLLKENLEHVPPYGKGDLYIRPIMFGSGQMLGVNPAEEYLFVIFMSPVGPYFKSGFGGIRLEIRDDFHRSAVYGTGGVKAVGNYAASLLPKKYAKKNGYDEVIYLDAKTSTYVEEVGSSNVFMIKEKVLSTPQLGGSILPGISRDSVLAIASHRFGLTTLERDIRHEEFSAADELFCTGTATVITPILSVAFHGREQVIGSGKPGPLTVQLYEELKGIQLGERPDDFGWFFEVT